MLQATGLIQYADDIGVLLACDWLLDRCRSVVRFIPFTSVPSNQSHPLR